MNLRLQQLLSAENLTQAEFAERIGVARASVSHILAGRNRPSFEVIQKISDSFPAVSLDWLINGNGRMYRQDSVQNADYQAKNLETQDLGAEPALFEEPTAGSPAASRNTLSDTLVQTRQKPKQQRIISKVVVFFNDGTFQELHSK